MVYSNEVKMNTQEISTFVERYIEFQERCKRIAHIISEYDSDFEQAYLRIWNINYDGLRSKNKLDCYTVNYIHNWVSGRIEEIKLSFPIELLSAADEEIHMYAQKNHGQHLYLN